MVERIEHYGAAVPTTLSSSLSSTAVTFNIADGTGWPTGALGKFYVTIDAGSGSEERILCSARSGTVVTVATSGRGVDGTAAAAHSANAPAVHSYSATEADDANVHQLATSAVHGVTGTLVGTTDTQTLTNKTLSGSANTFSNIPESAVTNLSADLSTLTGNVNAKVPLSTVTTKGDLIVATASGAVARVGVGTDGQVLTADSTQASGVKWGSGATSGAWTTFVPTFTGVTGGSGVFAYRLDGNTLFVRGAFSAGNSQTISAIGVNIPLTTVGGQQQIFVAKYNGQLVSGYINASSSTMYLTKDYTGAAWTNGSAVAGLEFTAVLEVV